MVLRIVLRMDLQSVPIHSRAHICHLNDTITRSFTHGFEDGEIRGFWYNAFAVSPLNIDRDSFKMPIILFQAVFNSLGCIINENTILLI